MKNKGNYSKWLPKRDNKTFKIKKKRKIPNFFVVEESVCWNVIHLDLIAFIFKDVFCTAKSIKIKKSNKNITLC